MFYECNHCHKVFNGKPQLENGKDYRCKYCPECATKLLSKFHSAPKKIPTDICRWCLKSIKDDPSAEGGVHGECIKLRDQVLISVRTSPQMALYVARIEARDGPARDLAISNTNDSMLKSNESIALLESKIAELAREINTLKGVK